MGRATALVVLVLGLVLAWGDPAAARPAAVGRAQPGPSVRGGNSAGRAVSVAGRLAVAEAKIASKAKASKRVVAASEARAKADAKAKAKAGVREAAVNRSQSVRAVAPTTPSTTEREPEHVVRGDDAAVLAPAVAVDAPRHDVQVLGERFERPPPPTTTPTTTTSGARMASTGPTAPLPDLLAVAIALVAAGAALQRRQQRTSRAP